MFTPPTTGRSLFARSRLRFWIFRAPPRERRADHAGGPPHGRPVSMREDGFLLVEVIVSALITALIVIGTFNGFDAVNRLSVDQRAHDQAVIIATQSQEQLRSDSASTLDALEGTPHTYTTTVDGTEYKVTQEATPTYGSAETTGCSALETSRTTAANVLITSSATWPSLAATSRPVVSLSSIITTPTGSTVEVDAQNLPTPTAGVPGITALVTYLPNASTLSTTSQGTTNANGCVVFSGIPATQATVAISEKAGYVNTAGLVKYPTKTITIAPSITTHYPIDFVQGGAIEASFKYGSTAVTGEDFVVSNTEMTAEPKFEVGSTKFTYESTGEGRYLPAAVTPESTALTAHGPLYSSGDLFPFTGKWAVYAGDCPENLPSKYVSTILAGSTTVVAGGTAKANAPMSRVTLAVREGTSSSPGALYNKKLLVKITDTACSAYAVPNNASAADLLHEQETTTSGALTYPYQPFGAYKLVIEANGRRYTYTGTNTTEAGSSPTIYIGATSSAQAGTGVTEEVG